MKPAQGNTEHHCQLYDFSIKYNLTAFLFNVIGPMKRKVCGIQKKKILLHSHNYVKKKKTWNHSKDTYIRYKPVFLKPPTWKTSFFFPSNPFWSDIFIKYIKSELLQNVKVGIQNMFYFFFSLRFNRQKLPCLMAMKSYSKSLNDLVIVHWQWKRFYTLTSVCRPILGEALL